MQDFRKLIKGARMHGAVVRALASYQCGSGSYTGLLLVIILSASAFSNVFPFPDAQLRKFQTFPNSISLRNQRGTRLFIRKGLLSVTLDETLVDCVYTGFITRSFCEASFDLIGAYFQLKFLVFVCPCRGWRRSLVLRAQDFVIRESRSTYCPLGYLSCYICLVKGGLT